MSVSIASPSCVECIPVVIGADCGSDVGTDVDVGASGVVDMLGAAMVVSAFAMSTSSIDIVGEVNEGRLRFVTSGTVCRIIRAANESLNDIDVDSCAVGDCCCIGEAVRLPGPADSTMGVTCAWLWTAGMHP